MLIPRKIFYFAVVVSFLLSNVACTSIQEIKIGDIHEVELKGLKDNLLTLKVMVPVENPNSFNVKVKDADLVVMLGKKQIGKVKQIDNLLISGKSTKEYPVTIVVELTNAKELMANAFQMFSGGLPDARLSGTVVVKSLFYRKKVRIEDFPLSK